MSHITMDWLADLWQSARMEIDDSEFVRELIERDREPVPFVLTEHAEKI